MMIYPRRYRFEFSEAVLPNKALGLPHSRRILAYFIYFIFGVGSGPGDGGMNPTAP